jgi:signal recognition particle subunit SRP54
MFNSLSDRLTSVFDRLRRRGALSEQDVAEALREIRIALLEADVALSVVKDFIAGVRERAVGQEVIKSITPGQMVVKIVHDHLIEMLGTDAVPINLSTQPPAVILMAGLQGSGKTTTTGKLALRLSRQQKKRVLMASLDVYRPAAQEQLATLGRQVQIDTLPIIAGQKPLQIAERALTQAKRELYDVLLLDTAGRLHVDQDLMDELVQVHRLASPIESLLVTDAMTGQDAVQVASHFKAAVPLTGIVLTRIDSDARGGAALSMRAMTGCPIKLLGTGEKLDGLEDFHPSRIADRILGMGDIVSLVERAAEAVDKAEAEKLATKMQKGRFDLEDLAAQFRQMKKMGGMASLMSMIPGVGKMVGQLNAGDAEKTIKRQEAIILSMTRTERRNPKILNASRKRRIALGAGVQVQDVNRLLKQHEQMAGMMKKFGKMDKKQLMRMLPPQMRG